VRRGTLPELIFFRRGNGPRRQGAGAWPLHPLQEVEGMGLGPRGGMSALTFTTRRPARASHHRPRVLLRLGKPLPLWAQRWGRAFSFFCFSGCCVRRQLLDVGAHRADLQCRAHRHRSTASPLASFKYTAAPGLEPSYLSKPTTAWWFPSSTQMGTVRPSGRKARR